MSGGPIDNFDILQCFIPEVFDGDTFFYTEILDRSKRSGNNKGRRLKTFYHRTDDELHKQKEQIVEICNYFNARAYFRPSSRSFKQVGQKFAAHLLEQAFSENWEGMRHGYSSCCGKTRLGKVWLFDFDAHDETPLSEWLMKDPRSLRVPSRKGFHVLTAPFDRRIVDGFDEDIQIHCDNPTNLYIPSINRENGR